MKKVYLLLITFLATLSLFSQSVTIGSGSFAGINTYGPANTSTTANSISRYAYIYPSSLLGILKHGDTINSLEFRRAGNDVITGAANMKIYIRNTSANTYGAGNIHWGNRVASVGMKKVYDKNPTNDIGNAPGFRRFSLDTVYAYDTTNGKNLEILIEYTQPNTLFTTITWNYDNSATVSAYAPNQTKYFRGNATSFPDSTNASDERHPQMIINFPRANVDAGFRFIYCLGKIPVPLGNPDSVKVMAENYGKRDINNLKVYFESKGANNLIDSTLISLPFGGQKLITLPVLSPSNVGMDTLIVRVANDDNNTNNTITRLRQATEDIYSYKDPATAPAPGGIGFNGATGDFVAKFQSNNQKAINQITVSFGIGGNNFQIGIWAANGPNGSPGTNLWTSDTSISTVQPFIMPVFPPVSVNGSFFVGVRQIGTSNVAFGYQSEDPVRPNTFFFTSPTGSTSWVDFSPNAPFRFMIEPRLQADNDVAAFENVFPKTNLDMTVVKTFAPVAKIYNLGAKSQTTPFETELTISQFGTTYYADTRSDTLGAGKVKTIVFDTTFTPPTTGTYEMRLVTKLGTDQVKQNDTLITSFEAGIFTDVGPLFGFLPESRNDYQLNRDSIFSVVRIQNYGLDNPGTFSVTARILDSNNVSQWTETKAVNLDPLSSNLMNFNTVPCTKVGKFRFVVTTNLANDRIKSNDTLVIPYEVVKDDDVRVLNFITPKKDSVFSILPANFTPQIQITNDGEANQNSLFPVSLEVLFANKVIHKDTANTTCFKGAPVFVQFGKNFSASKPGVYTIRAKTLLNNDQDKSNDQLSSTFVLGMQKDVSPIEFTFPMSDSNFQIGTNYAPKVKFKNNGFTNIATTFPVKIEIYGPTATLLYSNTKNITLDSFETKEVTFDNTFVPTEPGAYRMVTFSAYSQDLFTANDTLEAIAYGVRNKDITPAQLLFPNHLDSFEVNKDNFKVKASFTNIGLLNQGFPFTVRCQIIDPFNSIAYQSNAIIDQLSVGALDTVEFEPAFVPQFGGIHTVRVIALLFDDQYRKNDTLKININATNTNDVSPRFIVFPLPGAEYPKKDTLITPQVIYENWGSKNQSTPFPVTFRIITPDNQEVYSHTKDITMSPIMQLPVIFDKTFSFNTPGKYIMLAYSALPGDQKVSNDTIVGSFEIKDNSGIVSINNLNFTIYPNPTNNKLVVQLAAGVMPEQLSVLLRDATGKEVAVPIVSDNNGKWVLDVSGISDGIYFVTIETANGSATYRIIKTKN